jgi:hypothetical protein
MHIQTPIAEIIHPKEKTIHKNPPPRQVQEKERAKEA